MSSIISDSNEPVTPPTTSYWPGHTPTPGDIQPYKRAGSTKKDLIKRYTQRLKTSKTWRKEAGFEDTWHRLIDLYRMKQFLERSDNDRIAVNVSFSTVNTIVPSISVNYPQISVNPRDPQEMPQAQAAEAAVNYWWRHYDWRKEIQRAVKDALIMGNGWIKVGWRYQTSARALTDAERADVIEDAKEKASQQAAEQPETAAAQPTDDEIEAQAPQETYEVEVDEPFVERVSPFDIFIDPEATCIEDLKWIAQRLVVPIADARKDNRYKLGPRRALQPDMSTNVRWRDDEETDADTGRKRYADDVKRVTLWEFYDLRSSFYCVFAEDGEDFLLDPTDFPYPYGQPFVHLGNYDVPDQFYAMGDLEALEPLQHELNAVRSDMMNHRKRWQRAYLINKDAFDTAAQNQLLSDRDNRLVYVDAQSGPLKDMIEPVPQLPLDPQMYQYSEQIESDVDLISGVSEYQRGAQAEIRRTATEAAMIQDATNARAADKLAQIEVFMADVARRVVQLAQVYLTGDENIARIVGPDGAQNWVPFDRESIQGEFDFEVEAGSTQPRDESYRRQQALQLLNTLAPYAEQGVINMQTMLSTVLRDAFGIKDVSDWVQQPPQESDQPSDRLIENLNYKDAPPDIQRQIEAQAGLTPSGWGGQAQPGQSQQGGAAPTGAGEPASGSTAPQQMPQAGAAAPTPGPNMPPQLIAQLTNQMHTELPHS